MSPRRGDVRRVLPLAPVVQRAADDVEVVVYDDDMGGTTSRHFYRPGQVAYLTDRYGKHPSESGLRWQVTRTEET